MLFFFVSTVSPEEKIGRDVVNYGRHAHSVAEAQFGQAINSPPLVSLGFSVNARRQIVHANKYEINERLVFIASQAHGTSLVMATFIREAILPQRMRSRIRYTEIS